MKVRRIAGLEAVDDAVGRATEMGRSVLYIPGMQDMNDIQTIAALTILSRVAKTAAEYDARDRGADDPLARHDRGARDGTGGIPRGRPARGVFAGPGLLRHRRTVRVRGLYPGADGARAAGRLLLHGLVFCRVADPGRDWATALAPFRLPERRSRPSCRSSSPRATTRSSAKSSSPRPHTSPANPISSAASRARTSASSSWPQASSRASLAATLASAHRLSRRSDRSSTS